MQNCRALNPCSKSVFPYIHPGHIEGGPEEPDLAVGAPVGLHALEDLLGVVQHLQDKLEDSPTRHKT